MIFFRNNAIPPSWTLKLPEGWGESKTDFKERSIGVFCFLLFKIAAAIKEPSEFQLENGCSAGYIGPVNPTFWVLKLSIYQMFSQWNSMPHTFHAMAKRNQQHQKHYLQSTCWLQRDIEGILQLKLTIPVGGGLRHSPLCEVHKV